MDAVSSSIAIIDAAVKITKCAIDVWNAPEEMRQVKNELENLQLVLQRLLQRCKDVVPGDALWLRSEHKGILAEFISIVTELNNSMHPTKEYKKSQAYQRFVWHWKKEKISDLQNKIDKCFNFILVELALESDETLRRNFMKAGKTLDSIEADSKIVKTIITDLIDRSEVIYGAVSSLQIDSQETKKRWLREDEEKERKRKEKEKTVIMAWLSPLSFIAKQEQLYDDCLKETGDWLWQDPRFQSWIQGRRWFLYCIGNLGVGKTVLSSILAHRLPASSQPPLILCLYLNYKDSSVQTANQLICSLLKQVFQLDESRPIPNQLRELHKKATRLEIPAVRYSKETQQILISELNQIDHFYLIVDAPDELRSDERSELFNRLQTLLREKSRVVVMTRPIQGQTRTLDYPRCDRCKEPDIKWWSHCTLCNDNNYDLCLACQAKGETCLVPSHKLIEPLPREVNITVEIPRQDIEKYVRWEMQPSTTSREPIDDPTIGPERLNTTMFQDMVEKDPNLIEEIVSVVTNKANGRFLFARLYMDSLKMQSNRKTLKRTLRNFPEEIHGIYKEALARVKSQRSEGNREKAFMILGLVTHARRPLSLLELQHGLSAMDLKDDEEEIEENIRDGVDEAKFIFDCTSALVIVVKRDKTTQSIESDNLEVKLVHRTLEDYLREEKEKEEWLKDVDIQIAKACLKYLNIALKSPPQDDKECLSRSNKFPFLEYASQYWGDHIRYAAGRHASTEDIQERTLQFLNDRLRLNACIQVAWVTNPGGHNHWDVRRNIDRLHVCAWYGLSFAVEALDPERGRIDVTEPKYKQTPLMYACRRNHLDTVRRLLNLGASCAKVSARGRTALFEAVEGQHEEVIELFLETKPFDLEINLTNPREFRRTALMLAVRKNLKDIVMLLLQYPGINVNAQDANGWTALYIAVKFDYEELVELLLNANADIDLQDKQEGRSALRCAAERNQISILERLLKSGAELNLQDKRGGTAMLRAVKQGKLESLQAMMRYNEGLHFEAIMRCVDKDKQTLLHGASAKIQDNNSGEYDEIASWLLNPLDETGQKSVYHGHEIDPLDQAGRTPLHLASQYGRLALVQILLKNGADPTLVDGSGRTAKTIAWQYERFTVVRTLETEISPAPPPQTLPENSQLPFWAILLRKSSPILSEGLQTRPEEDLLIKEPVTENSVLHCAVVGGSPDLLSQLLSLPNPLPLDDQNRDGRTPLHYASLLGRLPLVELLLTHDAALDIKDCWGDEALMLAQSNFHYTVMFALIEAGADLDKEKIEVEDFFFKAIEEKRAATVRILLARWGLDRSLQNSDGSRPEEIAKAHDDVEMVKVLKNAPTMMFA